MKIIIIEDEPLARKELNRLLAKQDRSFTIEAEIDTVSDSISWLSNNKHPDLIFLDIQLADGISFEIFRHVNVKSPVIFTTAYDEYAIQAFQLNSIDYLLKPIEEDALDRALKKLDDFKPDVTPGSFSLSMDQIEGLFNSKQKKYKSRLILKRGDTITSVDISEVAYFYAEDNIVFVRLKDQGRYIVDYTLGQLEEQMDPGQFFRLSRGYITSIGAINKVSKYFNSRLSVELDPPADEKVLISRAKVPSFLEWLDR
jgi:DNA-binding LytR/AlgR family response regulator